LTDIPIETFSVIQFVLIFFLYFLNFLKLFFGIGFKKM